MPKILSDFGGAGQTRCAVASSRSPQTARLAMKIERMGEGRAALHFGQQKIHLDAAGGAMAMSGEKRMPAHICFITEAPMGEVTTHLETCGVPIRMQGPRAGAIGTIQSVYIDDPDHNSIEISSY